MIGETVERLPGKHYAWLFWMLMAAICAAGSFAMEEHHFLILAIAPAAIGLGSLATRRPRFAMRFEEDGIHVLAPREEFIPYRKIEALCANDDPRYRNRSFPFGIVHAGGMLAVPHELNVPSIDVYRWVKYELPRDEWIDPPAALRPYQKHNEEEFGERQVWGYRSLVDPKPPHDWQALCVSITLTLAGVIWIIIGAENAKYEGWAIAGCILLGISLMLSTILAIVGISQRHRGSGDGGIVIGPIGFALEQGNLLGQMRWDEVTKIEFRRAQYAVIIRFAGGEISLRDDYHRPIREIHGCLLDFWEGPYDDGDLR